MGDARSFRWLDDSKRDVLYGARLLRRNPLFALTAALSLAIGIGADTAIFTVANTLLFRAPAGVASPDRLVDIVHVENRSGSLADPNIWFTAYKELRRRVTTLDDAYACQIDLTPVGLRGPDGAERIFASLVTSNYFKVLGVTPGAGRFFTSVDPGIPGDIAPEVVLSHKFWSVRFNADRAIVGQTLRLNGQSFTVAGVASDDFRGTGVVAPDVWTATPTAHLLSPGLSEANLRLLVGGRLKPGISLSQAAAEIEVLGRALEQILPTPERLGVPPGTKVEGGLRVRAASPIPDPIRSVAAGFFTLLIVLVSFVLVIACANLAGVLLARATARRREIAVRMAIGAGRAQLIRQLLIETVMLFLLGGAAGLALARILISVVIKVLPEFPLPVNLSFPLDGRIVLFTAGLSLIAAGLSGLLPALRASKTDVLSALKYDEQGPSDRARIRHAFVVVQVAFSILLVVAGGLLVRALGKSATIDRGFDASGVELASLDLSLAGYTNATGPAFARELVDRVRELPGVQSAALADRAPTPGGGINMFNEGITAPGVAPPTGQPFFRVTWNIVEPGFFSTLRIPIVAGRDFEPADRDSTQRVVIVTQATARRLWPGQQAVGKQLVWQLGRIGDPSKPSRPPSQMLVVGVAKDVKSNRPGGDLAPLELYAPLQQRYTPHVTIIARTPSGRMTGEIRRLVTSMDPNLPILRATTLDAEITGPVETQLRVAASVSASMGIVSLLLATIGIYGVTAYAVTRRTREIGIRVAMGAERADVIGMILRQGMSLVALGSAIGLSLAAAGSRVLVRLLFGVPPVDPITFAGAALLFGAIGFLACYVPARRATRINAMEALRYE
jgi:putative ABC transport system permease protein